ncbi:pantoate--beta-alanine ligase [Roseibium album]|uniref:Pantothenate synthetase n=1 Tax=Roseibium album TaxID=311410 RepID=A0A0M7A1Q0_9HYPH|nr:pantoate--beta-alanine ligase [Roseibium album]MBG6199839.1 pantoate--beta-alanine ligase [Labrenzia sp. EL_13]CTQ61469.1 Pantothenate synthetase [Roseibium album]CTQ68376.1 Pantothenate synthetase [Roseibium album]CTQ79481.1 Pantothenate synthetase [Roseibium album]
MIICRTKADMRENVRNWKQVGQTVGLVPTMGYLHEGHLALVRMAIQKADRVVASIFVNPTQFGPNEDLATYPRDEKQDLGLLAAEGVDAVFLPSEEEMYGAGGGTHVDVPDLSGILQGALRPGHFRGVSTVVTKLFNIVAPDIAVFGEKDYQQLTLIRQMVRDLDMPLEIVGHPTVRESDGLAMSSRNVRLSEDHRSEAVMLNRALDRAQEFAKTGPAIAELEAVVMSRLAQAPSAEVKSVDIRDAVTLGELQGALDRPAVVLLAVRFGPVLLIDQRVIAPVT